MNPFFKRKKTKKQLERRRQILIVLLALLAMFLMAFVPYFIGKVNEFHQNGNTFSQLETKALLGTVATNFSNIL